jgi:hypothetical protein
MINITKIKIWDFKKGEIKEKENYKVREKLEKMKIGVFNNTSYWGYSSKVLKSGICKYYRRGMFEKFEWCVMEMMILGYGSKGIVTNTVNRLKILIMEEIIPTEVEALVTSIKIFEKIDNTIELYEKVDLIRLLLRTVKDCKRGRHSSYVGNWYRFRYSMNKNPLLMEELNDIVPKKVNKFAKKGDSLELLKLGELLISMIETKNERVADVYCSMRVMTGIAGTRYRRKDPVYLYMQILESYMVGSNAKKVFSFTLDRFNRKQMKERDAFGIWLGLLVIKNKSFDKGTPKIIDKYIPGVSGLYLYCVREYMDIDDDFVVNDWHVNKSHGLAKFGTVGAMVINENLEDLDNGEVMREYYIAVKNATGTAEEYKSRNPVLIKKYNSETEKKTIIDSDTESDTESDT